MTILLLSNGCLKSTPVKGAVNSFDSSAYLTLVTTDSVIQTCKADLVTNKFPANIVPSVKTALNSLIQAYNVANVAYQGYHTAVVAGQVPAPQFSQVAVNNALNSVQTATTQLISAKAGN